MEFITSICNSLGVQLLIYKLFNDDSSDRFSILNKLVWFIIVRFSILVKWLKFNSETKSLPFPPEY